MPRGDGKRRYGSFDTSQIWWKAPCQALTIQFAHWHHGFHAIQPTRMNENRVKLQVSDDLKLLYYPPQTLTSPFSRPSSTKRSMFSKLGAKKYTASKGRAWQGRCDPSSPHAQRKSGSGAKLWCRAMHMLQTVFANGCVHGSAKSRKAKSRKVATK